MEGSSCKALNVRSYRFHFCDIQHAVCTGRLPLLVHFLTLACPLQPNKRAYACPGQRFGQSPAVDEKPLTYYKVLAFLSPIDQAHVHFLIKEHNLLILVYAYCYLAPLNHFIDIDAGG